MRRQEFLATLLKNVSDFIEFMDEKDQEIVTEEGYIHEPFCEIDLTEGEWVEQFLTFLELSSDA